MSQSTAPAVPAQAQAQAEPLRTKRDALRAKILGRKPKREVVELVDEAGEKYDVELLEPSVEHTLKRDTNEDTPMHERMVDLVIQHTYIPGTNDKIFEPEDKEMLMTLPFAGEFGTLFIKVMRLSNLQAAVEDQAKNLPKTSPSS